MELKRNLSDTEKDILSRLDYQIYILELKKDLLIKEKSKVIGCSIPYIEVNLRDSQILKEMKEYNNKLFEYMKIDCNTSVLT